MKHLIRIALCLAFASCKGTYTTNVCNEKNGIDSKDFIGKFKIEETVVRKTWHISKLKNSKKGEYLVNSFYRKEERGSFTLRICNIEEHTIAEYPLREGLGSRNKTTHSFVYKNNDSFELTGIKFFKNKKNRIITFDNSKMSPEEFTKFTFENKRDSYQSDLTRIKK